MCVDDNVLQQKIRQREKDKKEGRKFKLLNTIHFRLYGAGLCKNLQINHFLVILLHGINSCLIYMASGSMLGAMLYLLNPAMNQTAIWMNGRRYAVGILCVLLAWNFKVLFLPLYIFASWLHVYTIAFPLILLFTDYWVIPIIGMVFAFVFARKPTILKFKGRMKDYAKGNEYQRVTPKKIVLYVKSLGFYFWHTLIPNKPRMYHEFMYYFSRYESENKRGYSLNFDFFKGLSVVAFIGYELIVNQNIWALWWLVFISQYSNIVTVTQNVADRYCSLSGIGLMMILSKYLTALPSPYMETVTGVIFTFYILRYIPLFKAYRSIEDYHLYHVRIQPDGVESRALLSDLYLRNKDAYRAFALIKDGLRYRPTDFKLLFIMSQIMFALNKVKDGLNCLDIAQKYAPIGDEEPCKEEFNKMREHYNKFLPKQNTIKLEEGKEVVVNRKQKRAYERKQRKSGKKTE